MSHNQAGTFATVAIVLRTRNLGEKDRVMTLLSPEGKFSAVAKGARGGKAKLAPVAQPFVQARFLIAHGRSIDIATQAQIENAFAGISANLLRTAWASYLCELCDHLPENQPEAMVYQLLESALTALNEAAPQAVPLIGHWFEARYLADLGYSPTIGVCVACGEKIVGSKQVAGQVTFSAAMGGTLCDSCAGRDGDRQRVSLVALRVLHKMLGADVAPAATSLSPAQLRELRDCLRAQLAVHLETRFKSQRFLDQFAEST